jgi:filamentous hemagglutinin
LSVFSGIKAFGKYITGTYNMAQEIINVGPLPNDGLGDPLRLAFTKTNNNFSQLFAAGGVSGISNGTSNVTVLEDAQVIISSGGISNVVVVTAVGATVKGTLIANAAMSATGNITAGQFFFGNGSQLTGVVSVAAAALITGNTLSSNVVTSSLTTVGTLGTLSVLGNITSGNINSPGQVVATGNISGGNLSATTQINASGNITGGNLITGGVVSVGGAVSAAGNVTGAFLIGNGSQISGLSISSNAALLVGTVLSANVVDSSLQSVGSLNSLVVSNALGGTGTVTSNNVNAGSVISATGNITGGNINTAGAVSSSGTIVATGNITGGNLSVGTGNIVGGNIDINTGITSGATVSAVANITGGNLRTAGQVSATGLITGGNITTVGTANVNALTVVTTASAAGNITGGNVNSGNVVSATGNVVAGNVTSLGLVSSTGNVTAPNFIGNVIGNISGNLAAPGANTQVIFNDSATANATANLTFDKATNALTAAGTVSGGNLITGGNLSVTGDSILVGNLTVSGTTEYNNVTNLAIQDPIITLGRGANNAPLVSTTTTDRGEQLYYYSGTERSAFIGYQSSTGKLIAAVAASVTNEIVTITTAGSFVVGTLEGAVVSVTGNITGGNVLGGANVNATTHTGTTVSVTGNITGGNVLGGANVNATLFTGTTVSMSGNVTGGNVISSALMRGASLSVTGNTATVTTANYQIGYRDLPQITSFATLVADAGGKHYYGTGTITIPSSGTTNFAIGTAILIIASNSTTISNAGGVTLVQAGTGSTGARTLAQHAEASLVKVGTDTWYISGVGIS